MTNEIIDFISSFQMVGNGTDLINTFNISASKTEIKSKIDKSFLVSDFSNAVEILNKIPTIDNGKDFNKDLKQSLNSNLISEQEPFWIVISVKDGQPIL